MLPTLLMKRMEFEKDTPAVESGSKLTHVCWKKSQKVQKKGETQSDSQNFPFFCSISPLYSEHQGFVPTKNSGSNPV